MRVHVQIDIDKCNYFQKKSTIPSMFKNSHSGFKKREKYQISNFHWNIMITNSRKLKWESWKQMVSLLKCIIECHSFNPGLIKCFAGCSMIRPQWSNPEQLGQVWTQQSNLIQLRVWILIKYLTEHKILTQDEPVQRIQKNSLI